jgi:hypothetical protein
VWTLSAQVRPRELYCGAAQEVLVEIRDQLGQCQIDFGSIVGGRISSRDLRGGLLRLQVCWLGRVFW